MDVVRWVPRWAAGGCGSRHSCRNLNNYMCVTRIVTVEGNAAADVPWTAGVIYIDGQREAAEARIAAENTKERQRLLDLRNNEHLPLVFMDVSIKGDCEADFLHHADSLSPLGVPQHPAARQSGRHCRSCATVWLLRSPDFFFNQCAPPSCLQARPLGVWCLCCSLTSRRAPRRTTGSCSPARR